MALRLFEETAALRDFDPAHVRFGSEADITRLLGDVRFTPESGQTADSSICLLCAKSGHSAVQQISADLGSIFAVLG